MAQPKSVKLTTYYPAPAGAYDRLTLIPRGNINAPTGDEELNFPCTDTGTLYINNTTAHLHRALFCADDGTGTKRWSPFPGVWAQQQKNIFPVNLNAWVGIGTNDPRGHLHINDTVNPVPVDWSQNSVHNLDGELIIQADNPSIAFFDKNDAQQSSFFLMTNVDNSGNTLDTWAFGRRTPGDINHPSSLNLQYMTAAQNDYWQDAGRKFFFETTGDFEITGSTAEKNGVDPFWNVSSDERLKKNIREISNALDKLLQLQGVYFEWIHPENHGGQDSVQTGMIAQQVEKVFPDWVYEKNDGFKTYSLKGIEALAIEALRELKNELDLLMTVVLEQDAAIKELKHSSLKNDPPLSPK